MTIADIVVWIHVSAGIAWIGAALAFVLAAIAMERGSAERREFFVRAAKPIGMIGLAGAITIVITGISNLWFAGRARNFNFGSQFVAVLSVKIVLYLAMCLALIGIIRARIRMNAALRIDDTAAFDHESARISSLWAATAIMGAVALGAGLWLAGS